MEVQEEEKEKKVINLTKPTGKIKNVRQDLSGFKSVHSKPLTPSKKCRIRQPVSSFFNQKAKKEAKCN